MNPKTSARLLILLSILYGLTIAALSYFDVAKIGVFAVVGGVLLGIGWAARSMLGDRSRRSRDRAIERD